MADDTVIIATRVDIDNVVFSACTEVAEKLPGLSVRDKTKFAIAAADRIMEGVDDLGGKAKRSEAGKKAAEARYSKPKPTPGPAIPPPPAPSATVSPDMAVANAAIAAGMIPPPPHPSLAVPGATPAPFGSPPA